MYTHEFALLAVVAIPVLALVGINVYLWWEGERGTLLVPSSQALPSLIEKLEGGAILQYVVADYRSPKDVAVEGRGVQPDKTIAETRADYAAGRDPVLEAAVAALAAG